MRGGAICRPSTNSVQTVSASGRRGRESLADADLRGDERFAGDLSGRVLGAVIDENAANRLGTAIDQAKNRSGHKLLVGGSVDTEAGWFVEPTVIVAEDADSTLMQKEFFGPLLAVHVYDDADWRAC